MRTDMRTRRNGDDPPPASVPARPAGPRGDRRGHALRGRAARTRAAAALGAAAALILALSGCGGSGATGSAAYPASSDGSSAATSTSAGASAGASAAEPASQEGADLELTRAEPDGLSFDGFVYQGRGCPPNTGAVYPAAVTPGLTTSMPPGTGPKHGGQTWDAAPRLFGAVAASPVEISLSVTAPADHAVTITSMVFHALSRQPQVQGVLLNTEGQCGAPGGDFLLYGGIDFNRPAPYWLPPADLSSWARKTPIVLPLVVPAGGTRTLIVDVRMEHCDCTWDTVLTWVDRAATHTWTLDQRGKPFQTTSTTGLKGIAWSGAEPPTWSPTPLGSPE